MELSRRERRSKFRHPRLRRSPPQVPILLCDAICREFSCAHGWYSGSPSRKRTVFFVFQGIVHRSYAREWSRYPSSRLRPVFPASTQSANQPTTPRSATRNAQQRNATCYFEPPCLKKRTTDTALPYSMPRWQNKIRHVPADQKQQFGTPPQPSQ
jgi:hypothetical protein